jgi:hypothetical protein
MLPGATALAVATFWPENGDGAGELRKSYTGGGRLAGMEAIAASQTERATLEAALTTGNSRDTSVAFALRHAATRGCHIAWSKDFPEGLEAFSDWRAARRAGLNGHIVTAPLVAGRVCVGFVTAHAAADRPSSMTSSDRSSRLQALCEIVGAAVFCRRAWMRWRPASASSPTSFLRWLQRRSKRARAKSCRRECLCPSTTLQMTLDVLRWLPAPWRCRRCHACPEGPAVLPWRGASAATLTAGRAQRAPACAARAPARAASAAAVLAARRLRRSWRTATTSHPSSGGRGALTGGHPSQRARA